MIKPIFGAASIGVVRVDNKEQLEKTYIRVQEEVSGAKIVDGSLVAGNKNDTDGGVTLDYQGLVYNQSDVFTRQIQTRVQLYSMQQLAWTGFKEYLNNGSLHI